MEKKDLYTELEQIMNTYASQCENIQDELRMRMLDALNGFPKEDREIIEENIVYKMLKNKMEERLLPGDFVRVNDGLIGIVISGPDKWNTYNVLTATNQSVDDFINFLYKREELRKLDRRSDEFVWIIRMLTE